MSLVIFTFVLLLALEATAGAVGKTAFREHGWRRKLLAPRDGPMKLHIAVRLEDGGQEAERKLLEISDPNSPSYRQHLGPEAAYLSTPGQGSVHAIEYWLWKYNLLGNSSLFGGIYSVDTTVRTAERLLNTTYFVWSDGSQDVVRTERFYLPDEVVGHIDFVAPTTTFPKAASVGWPSQLARGITTAQKASQAQLLNERAECGANSLVTPTCIKRAYEIDYVPQPNRTTFAVYGTEAASFSASDVQTYLNRYNEPAANAYPQYDVVGDGDSSEGSDFTAKFETALDTQTLLGLAWPAEGVFYNLGGVFGPDRGSTYDPFVQFLQELITNKTVPTVVSFSESMPEDMMDANYARRLCNMMAQVGARGVTLLFSSGNNGPNGDQPTGTHKNIFESEFPASCPWVTAVGGTTNLADETAATKSTISVVGKLGYTASGGGFSNLFPTPEYQTSVVNSYVSKYVPASYNAEPGFNARGRGIPDISAFSTNFPTVVDLITFPTAGTSAATPLWAAVVTLLNDYEASKGRKPLGFLNPWLYSLNSGLKDITTGGNNAGSCYLISGCTLPKTLGYNVTEGWDPSTGLGSPIFAELRKALDSQASKENAASR